MRPAHPERTIDPQNQALLILLDGIARSALPSDAARMHQFRESMAKLYDEVKPSTGLRRAALIAEDAVRVLEEHNWAERDFLFTCQMDMQEMRAAIGLLADCLKRTGFMSRTTTEIVEAIAREAAEETPRPEELEALRGRLGEHLARAVVVSEHLRREEAPENLAATALYACWEKRRNMCAVLFGFERMAIINARFGYRVGDQLIAGLRRHLESSLGETDRLFRWRGPYLLALIERDLAAGLPRIEMSLIGSWCTEYEIKVRNHQALIPVSVSWELFPLEHFAGVEDIVGALDAWSAMLNSKGWSLKENPG